MWVSGCSLPPPTSCYPPVARCLHSLHCPSPPASLRTVLECQLCSNDKCCVIYCASRPSVPATWLPAAPLVVVTAAAAARIGGAGRGGARKGTYYPSTYLPTPRHSLYTSISQHQPHTLNSPSCLPHTSLHPLPELPLSLASSTLPAVPAVSFADTDTCFPYTVCYTYIPSRPSHSHCPLYLRPHHLPHPTLTPTQHRRKSL